VHATRAERKVDRGRVEQDTVACRANPRELAVANGSVPGSAASSINPPVSVRGAPGLRGADIPTSVPADVLGLRGADIDCDTQMLDARTLTGDRKHRAPDKPHPSAHLTRRS